MSSLPARLQILVLRHISGCIILAYRQHYVCFLSDTVCGKVKAALSSVRGTGRLVTFSVFLDAAVQFQQR
jgi:hypothetical protein